MFQRNGHDPKSTAQIDRQDLQRPAFGAVAHRRVSEYREMLSVGEKLHSKLHREGRHERSRRRQPLSSKGIFDETASDVLSRS